jgi:hypothetical protein
VNKELKTIKMGLAEMGWSGVDWIGLAHYMVRQRALVIVVRNI